RTRLPAALTVRVPQGRTESCRAWTKRSARKRSGAPTMAPATTSSQFTRVCPPRPSCRLTRRPASCPPPRPSCRPPPESEEGPGGGPGECYRRQRGEQGAGEVGQGERQPPAARQALDVHGVRREGGEAAQDAGAQERAEQPVGGPRLSDQHHQDAHQGT